MAITKTDSGKLKNPDEVVTDIGIDNEPTTGSDNLVTSGGIKNALDTKADKSDTYTKQEVNDAIAAATPADYDTVKSQVQQNTQDISGIKAKIPAQASAQNQLADKNFVNSSIATNTATFRGTYNLVSDLGLTVSATHEQVAAAIATKLATLSITPENNDYCFVQVPTSDADPTVISRVDRYKCTVTESGGVTSRTWDYEWSLNNSSFTADQWAAINSGITANLVSQISANQVAIGSLNSRDYVVIDTSTMRVAARKSDDALTREFNNLDNVASTTYTQGAMSVIFRPRDLFVNTITNLGLPMTISNRALTTFSLSSITLTMYVRDTGNPTKLVMSACRSIGDNSFVPVGTSDFVENITTGAIRDYTFTFHDFPASEAGDNYEFLITAKNANDTTIIPVIEFFGGGRYPVTDWSMRSAESPYSIISSGNRYALSMSMDATVYGEVEIPMARQSDIKITTVKVNGTALVPDGNKTVDVPVPTHASDVGALGNSGNQMLNGSISASNYLAANQLIVGTSNNGLIFSQDDLFVYATVKFGGSTIATYKFPKDSLLEGDNGNVARLLDIYAAVQQIAPAFQERTDQNPYNHGELVSKDGVVYQCDDASFYGPWSAESWVAKKVSELFLPLTGGTLKPGILTLEDSTGYKRVLRCSGTGGDFYIDYYSNQGTLVGSILVPSASGNKQFAFTDSPAFTGRPTAPNLTDQSADGQVANKKYVDEQVAGVPLRYALATKTATQTGTGFTFSSAAASGYHYEVEFDGTDTWSLYTVVDGSTHTSETATDTATGTESDTTITFSTAGVTATRNWAVALDDRTVNTVALTSSIAALEVSFPAAVADKVRDFELRLVIGDGTAAATAPALILPSGLTFANADGELPSLADGTATAAGVTMLYFSEVTLNNFLVKGEEMVTIV